MGGKNERKGQGKSMRHKGNKKGNKMDFRAQLLCTMFLIQINRKSIRIKCSGAPVTEFDTHCKHKRLSYIKIADIYAGYLQLCT